MGLKEAVRDWLGVGEGDAPLRPKSKRTRLSMRQKATIWEMDAEGFPQAEIAKAVGCSPATVWHWALIGRDRARMLQAKHQEARRRRRGLPDP